MLYSGHTCFYTAKSLFRVVIVGKTPFVLIGHQVFCTSILVLVEVLGRSEFAERRDWSAEKIYQCKGSWSSEVPDYNSWPPGTSTRVGKCCNTLQSQWWEHKSRSELICESMLFFCFVFVARNFPNLPNEHILSGGDRMQITVWQRAAASATNIAEQSNIKLDQLMASTENDRQARGTTVWQEIHT